MNYIHRLEFENEQLTRKLEEVRKALVSAQIYYSAPKFQGHDNDYAHVSTDVLPRLQEIKGIVTSL